jgi:hypothetical protein
LLMSIIVGHVSFSNYSERAVDVLVGLFFLTTLQYVNKPCD